MSKSKIDWCDETINIFTGCNGPDGKRCPYCYAQKMAKRLAAIPGQGKYRRIVENNGDPFAPAFHFDVIGTEMDRLKRARKPRRVFIGSMGDMCFDGNAECFDGLGRPDGPVNSGMVQRIVAQFCDNLPQHTFQILTKRPDLLSIEVKWPVNVHLGVSLSRDYDAHRITTLLDKKKLADYAAPDGRWPFKMVLWASVEPLLDEDFNPRYLRGLDWVVIGAETGGRKGVSSAYILAACRVVVWCAVNGIPCFVKDNMRQADHTYDWPREFPA